MPETGDGNNEGQQGNGSGKPEGKPDEGKPTGDEKVDWAAFGQELESQGLSPDKVKERLTHARTWEQRAKDNKTAAEELEKLKKSQMTDNDRAVAEAKEAGKKEAAGTYSQKLAAAELKAGLKGVVKDPEAIVEDLNLAKFVTDDGDVDDEAVKKLVAKYSDGRPATDQKQGNRGSSGKKETTGEDFIRSVGRS